MIRRWLDSVLVREWRAALRMWSVRLAILLGLMVEGWFLLDLDQQAAILALVPDQLEPHILALFSVVLVILRLKRQGIEGRGGDE